MKIRFKESVDISEIPKCADGVKPKFGMGLIKGSIWCPCGCCVGDILEKENIFTGFIDTACSSCGQQIDYSELINKYNLRGYKIK